MRTFFVTASGTEVGKTVVTTLLCRQLRAAGRRVRAIKPVITDFDDAAPMGSDTALLLEAQGLEVTPQTVAAASPWRFHAPLSPDMAARREGRSLDLDAMVDFCVAEADGHGDFLLIEGLGGVMVPLTDQCTVTDWIAELEAPALLVTGSYLGTLSHTLTAAEALRVRGVSVTAVIVSESPQSPVPLAETAETLRRFLRPLPVLALPRLGGHADAWRDAPDLTAPLMRAA